MAKKLTILDHNLGINANVKYDPLNMKGKDRQKIAFKAPSGERVTFTTVDVTRKPVQTFKAYLDEKGTEYSKMQLTAIDDATGDPLAEFESTTVFDIIKYEPEESYTDRYIVDKYYELAASDEGKKKDIDRKIACDLNRAQMKKLYDHLKQNHVVGKAEFVATTGHYRAGAGYIRAIEFDGGKWTLELGAFKEEKVFKHLNEPKIDLNAVRSEANKNKPVNKLL